jgi:3-dehydroquinate dehydratase type I
MNVKICVSVKAEGPAELAERALEAQRAGADLVESRLDFLSPPMGFERIPSLLDVPVIATVKSEREGGKYRGSEESRLELLERAGEAGYDYLDVELGSRALELLPQRWSLIVSWHEFSRTPEIDVLEEVLGRALSSGADIIKIVTTALRGIDNITVLRFLAKHSKSRRMVCFAMGEEGLPSRILSPLFGADFTYASLARGSETAPGQVPLAECRQMLKELFL